MKIKKVGKIFRLFLVGVMTCFMACVILVLFLISHYSRKLPNHEVLKSYNPPITTRLYSNDGKLLKEYAKEKRLFVPIERIPVYLKEAFIAAEDASFYNHPGVDFRALFAAAMYDVGAVIKGKPLRGASTITQQVAKNFLLTKDKTIERKIKEAILSFRMTQAFTKDRVLELYLNQIYLGNRSYGVAAAALNYFDKALDELTLEECAMLAALPKAPGSIDPTRNYERGLERRNYVLDRMAQERFITRKMAEKAKSIPINTRKRSRTETVDAEFFAEEVRKRLAGMYGEEDVMTGGKVVTTTLDPRLQRLADRYLKKGLEDYDRKHGFRGGVGNLLKDNKGFNSNWHVVLNDFEVGKSYNSKWERAVVLRVDDEGKKIDIGLEPVELVVEDEKKEVEVEETEFIKIDKSNQLIVRLGFIPLKNLLWARRYIDVNTVGREIEKPSDVALKKGDVILVRSERKKEGQYLLKQIPEINGSVIIMDPHNGRILAMMGGYIDSEISFNRATQAERQPGSVLKTFAYLAAMENGFTPADMVIDEEIELYQGDGKPPYRPRNYSEQFFGPTTLRIGLEKSRNVATVRLASEVGLRKITEVIRRFGINNYPRRIYSVVLGSTETNLIKLTNAYAMIVNGGRVIQPSLIEKVQDKKGNTIYRRDSRICQACNLTSEKSATKSIKPKNIIFPEMADTRKIITDSATAYQITSMLEGVVKRGTGWRARRIRKPVGGKTGTTNNVHDAWFIGFSPDLVVGVYAGYDSPRTLGEHESGSSVAAPIFVNIMEAALKDKPSVPFRVPSTVKLVKIDRQTGRYPTAVTKPKDIIFEAFKLSDTVKKEDGSEGGAGDTFWDNLINESNYSESSGESDGEGTNEPRIFREEKVLEDIESGVY